MNLLIYGEDLLRQLIAISIFVVILSACTTTTNPNSSDTPPPSTSTFVLPTVTYTLTSTLTPTLTSTPKPTATPSNTPTKTPDLTLLGVPESPLPWRGFNPYGFLEINDQDYSIYEREIHGRKVVVAIEKTTNWNENKQKSVSDFYFETFINWWDIFGGFLYDSYTVVIKVNPKNAGGEFGIGYEAYASSYNGGEGERERIAHEVFHAWVGNAVCDKQDSYFDDGLWFREGITQYYGDRGAGKIAFNNLMKDHFRIYQNEILGTEYDFPLSDMPNEQKKTGEMFGKIRLNVYWKGALVAYLMDQQLEMNNLSLDDFLRYLYNNYSLNKKCFGTKDTIEALNQISGEDWSVFFEKFIYGTEELPLDGKFQYLDH